MPVSHQAVCGTAQVIWLAAERAERFMRRWVSSSDSLWMKAHANAHTEVLTGEVQFGPGAESEGCPLHRASQGTRPEACPGSRVVRPGTGGGAAGWVPSDIRKWN